MSHRMLPGAIAILFVLVTLILPALAYAGAEPHAIVGVTALNVRQGPGTSYAVIDAAHAGDDLTITGKNAGGGWYRISTQDGRTGWVSSSYVQVSGDLSSVPEVTAAPGVTSVAGKQPGTSMIVFQASSGGQIYAVNPDGSNLHTLTTGMDPAISPDGKQVAFTRWDGTGNGVTGNLWVIGVDGSGERKVMTGAYQPKSPTWSADGQQIVISMQQGGTVTDAWVCIIDGKATTVKQPISGQRCMPQRANPLWGLKVVNAASGAYEDLPREQHSFAPTWDPANSWHVVFRGDHGLESLDMVQKTIWVLKEDGAARGPVFSPDGTKIATTYKQNDHWEVHVMNADGTAEVRLTETPLTVIMDQQLNGEEVKSWNNAAPAWSPDGSQIAFVTDRNGSWEIWVMNADGSNQRQLLPAALTAGLNIRYEGVDERVISWR